MATQKTSNDYREERKARLAKAAKKNSKKAHKVQVHSMSKKAKTVFGISVAAVVAIAIAVGVCFSYGVFDRMRKIETVGGEKYSQVEYEYYYKTLFTQVYGTAQQYESYYGSGYGAMYTGFDYTKLPEDQTYPGDDYKLEGDAKPTWKQYLEYAAMNNMQRNIILADMAKAANFEVSAEALAEVDSQLDELRTSIQEQAAQNGSMVMSLNAYLSQNFGRGMTEKIFLKIVERETIAAEYANHLIETNSKAYDLKELEKAYNEDPKSYNCVDFRMFTISAETAELDDDATSEEKENANKEAKEAAKKKANAMLEDITDEKSFIALAEKNATDAQKEANDYSDEQTTLSTYVTYEMVSSNFSTDILDWLFGDKAKANEKKMFEISGTYYIFYMLKPAYRDDTTIPVDVRHILYQIDEEAKDQEAEDKKQKALAEAALKTINQSSDKLATFLELVESDSKDTGSSSNGGLYEYVGKGQYVKEFENWALDEKRQEGDIEIVKTSYGYHLMYFVQKHDRPYWQIVISSELANDQLSAELDEKYASEHYAVAADNKAVAKLNNKINEEIQKLYYANATAAA